MCIECGWFATDDDPPAPPDELLGPTLEVRVTTTHICRASDVYGKLAELWEAAQGGEVRAVWDWNGINARPFDMSFVPLVLVRKD